MFERGVVVTLQDEIPIEAAPACRTTAQQFDPGEEGATHDPDVEHVNLTFCHAEVIGGESGVNVGAKPSFSSAAPILCRELAHFTHV